MKRRARGNPRAAAAELLTAVLDRQESLADASLQHYGLEPRDEAFARHLAYGVLRWMNALEWLAGKLLDRPLKKKDRDLHFLILMGIFQLWQDESAPHAAVHASAEAARALGKNWAVGLINAMLRTFQRQQPELLKALQKQETWFAHPGWLIDAIRQDWPEQWRDILTANNHQAPLWLRINRQRTDMDSYRAMLQEAELDSELTASAPDAVRVTPAVPVSRIPGFADGLVSVQDAAAQWAAVLMGPVEGDHVLDACAAPGGKTCHLLETTPGIHLTALDRQAGRVALISENLHRLGLRCTLKTADAGDLDSWWDGRKFNRILLDAPCSATGVIRRHPEIKWLRSPEQVERVVGLQAELLDKLWSVLEADGILVYATCSILKRENIEQIHAFLSRHDDAECIGPENAEPYCRQLLPGEEDMDGFFYAVLHKSA